MTTIYNGLEYTTKEINRNFRIKVNGMVDGKKINKLVGVQGLIELIGVEMANKMLRRAFNSKDDKTIFKNFTRKEFKEMSDKHIERISKNYIPKYEPIKELQRDITFYRNAGQYTKRLIIGHTHIYWASPYYGHKDYNKSIFSDNTPKNRRKAELINNLLDKNVKSAGEQRPA
nr:MAG: hypothetical protein [Bacteriophage sp.]